MVRANGAQPRLLITVVEDGKGSRVAAEICSTRPAYTVIMKALGTTHSPFSPMLGTVDEDYRDVVLSLLAGDQVDSVLDRLETKIPLNKAGSGIAFVVPVAGAVATIHAGGQPGDVKCLIERSMNGRMNQSNYKLIITIVNRGHAEEVVEAAKAAGAQGSTIVHARGTGIHENISFFGVAIEPEKEMIMTMIPKDIAETVMASIIKAADLNAPGKGIAFTLDVERVAGVAHLKE